MKKIKEFYDYTNKLYLSNLAASITFYLLFMLVPLINLINNILGYLHVEGFTSDEYLVRSNVLSIIMFVISIIFVSSKVVNSLAISTNIIYGDKNKRSTIRRRILSVLLMILFIILIIVQICLSFVISHIFKNILHFKLYSLVNLLYIFLSVSFISSIVYKYIIPVKVKLRRTFVISMVVSIIWYFATFFYDLFGTLFMNDSYSKLYGSLANLMLTMLWLYIIVLVYIYGIAFNFYFSKNYQVKK
ncbi:MAG: YihY/virulence factor BrkB family protein [Bacilli bacterium]|nr:YihY/virulence factor BrkB family protein [Bacilli bacterium]